MSYEETHRDTLNEGMNVNGPPPLSDEDLRLAATYVNDAQNGHRGNFKNDPKSVKLYNLYNNPVCIWTSHIAVGVLLALVLFEDPAVPNIRLDYWITMWVELVCVCVIFSRLAHQALFSSDENFWRSKLEKRLPILLIVLLTLIDMTLYVILSNIGVTSVRWSRPLRPLLLICMDRAKQLRGAFKNILLTLPDIITVLTLFLLSVAFFALMSLKIFQNRHDLFFYSDGQPYMHDYLDNFFHLYVLVTTANFPDVMMPAFDYSPWFGLFFITYLIICLYLFMSICLATIYNNFKEHLKEYVEDTVREKQDNLHLAFDILKVDTGNGREQLPKSRWMSLMRIVHPNRLDIEHSLLWDVLAIHRTGHISRREFLHVANLLDIQVLEVKDREPEFQRWFPRCFSSKLSRIIRKTVAHRFFRYFVDLAVVANAVCIALDQDDAEWFFMALFVLEILLKFYVFGLKKFFHSAMNIFDFVLIVAALVINVIELGWTSISNQSGALDFLLVLRLLRLVRLVYAIERFRIVLKTISSIGRSLVTYGGVLFVFFYVFAIIGMEIFSGKVHPEPVTANRTREHPVLCGNPNLTGTQFAANRYCNNNFNDILHSFVVLFELMVVNQWHVIAEGFVAVTNQAARIYFIIYHLLVVILVLNIFSAFILELFMLEYTISKEPAQRRNSLVERRITVMGLDEDQSPYLDDLEDLDTGTEEDIEMAGDRTRRRPEHSPAMRFRLSKGANKVEELLQKMYEIGQEEEDSDV